METQKTTKTRCCGITPFETTPFDERSNTATHEWELVQVDTISNPRAKRNESCNKLKFGLF